MTQFWLEVPTCDFCGSRARQLYMESSVPPWYKGKPIRLEECTQCGLVYANPRPDPQAIYQDYLTGGAKSQAAVERKMGRPNVMAVHTKAVETALEYVKGAKKPLRLFDMGCGAGTILEAAKQAGLEAEGNDINLAAIKRLQELGFNAHHGFTQDLKLPRDSFDIVINFDYLEHSYTPKEDLQVCLDILKPGGILYLKTLYLDCPDHLLKGEHYQLFGNGHFHYFRPRSLVETVRKLGFVVEDVKLGPLIFIIARKPGPEQHKLV